MFRETTGGGGHQNAPFLLRFVARLYRSSDGWMKAGRRGAACCRESDGAMVRRAGAVAPVRRPTLPLRFRRSLFRLAWLMSVDVQVLIVHTVSLLVVGRVVVQLYIRCTGI